MTQEQIEAVRRDISALRNGLLYPWQHDAAKDRILAALDQLTKANEELRAEVELAKQEGVAETLQQIDCLTGGDGEYRLSTCPDRNCPDEDAMRAKIVARFDDLRAAVDRLTKERDWVCERLDAMTTEGANRDEHLSAMQEAIDEAYKAAMGDNPCAVVQLLRPFATKPEPEPEVDPLVAATQRLLQYEGHMVWCGHGNDDSKPCVCGLIDAQSKARDALAARNHTEGRTDG